jgi:hypothetical protein
VTWTEEWADEPAVLRRPLIDAWAAQQRFLAEHGDITVHPDTGEIIVRVPRPIIRPGVSLRSLSQKRVDLGVMGKGGAVISRSDDDAGYETVEAFRGQVHRFRVMDEDIDDQQYTGVIDVRWLEGQRRAIAAVMAGPRSRHNIAHLGALAVITAVLENPSMCSNLDRDVDPRLQ